MYSSLQDLNQEVFWTQMVVFCFIASTAVANVLLMYYAEQRFCINWIEWLNRHFVDRWLANQAYYKTAFMELDNPSFEGNLLSHIRQKIAPIRGYFLFLKWG